MMHRYFRIVLCCLPCLLLVHSSLAQTSQPEKNKETQKSKSKDKQGKTDNLLAGPEIVESDSGGAAVFGGASRDRRIANIKVPPPLWVKLLLTLDLKEEQQEEIQDLQTQLQLDTRAFRREYGKELKDIDQKRRKARSDNRDFDPKLVLRSREIMQKQPRVIDVQKKIWDVLTEEQQFEFQDMLAVERKRIAEVRAKKSAQEMELMREDTMEKMLPPDSQDGPERRNEEMRNRSNWVDQRGFDNAGRRRIRFLRSLQKSRSRGAAPDEEDRKIKFEETETDKNETDDG